MQKEFCKNDMEYLNQNEGIMLSIIDRLENSGRKTDTASIAYLVDRRVPQVKPIWKATLERLVEKEILLRNNTITNQCNGLDKDFYSITEYGKRFLDKVRNQRYLVKMFYDEFYKRAQSSAAHSDFCKQTYGMDLCQHGMLDMTQLHKFLDISHLNNSTNILELGCGNGMIAEYISDATDCLIKGIDISTYAIECAIERTTAKRHRLSFSNLLIEDICQEQAEYDAILSIDTLYFVSDLDMTLNTMNRSLKRNGVMYIFFHTPPQDEAGNRTDCHEQSFLGKALGKLGVKYDVIDFTKLNKYHWEIKQEVLAGLKDRFEKEGNMFLYNNRMDECEGKLGEWSRFLYIIGKYCMERKITKVSGKRQIAIPQKYFEVLRSIRENTGSEFSEQILADLIAQGFSGQELLVKFKELSKKNHSCYE